MEEIMKTHRNLPNRPTIEEVEDAKTLIQKVEAEAQSKLDAISRGKKSINMPDDMLNVLQEMRRNIVHFESKEQKRKAVRLLDLENAHQMSAKLIQRASKCVGSDTRLEVMAMKGSDGKKVPLPVWIWTLPPDPDRKPLWLDGQRSLKTLFHCVDIMEEDVYSQIKFRLSLHARDDRQNSKRKCTDGDSDVTKLALPEGALGLRLRGDSLAKGILLTSVSKALGSFIYMVGGSNGPPFEKTIHYLDTKSLHLGWRTHSMKVGRSYPNVAAVDGKLYIVGGAAGPDGRITDRLWEIFDPQTGLSEIMPDAPREYADYMRLITVLPDSKEILFYSKKPFYFLYYSVNGGKWRIDLNDDKENGDILMRIEEEFKDSVNVVIGNIIYWFSNSCMLTAYDFSTRKFYTSNSSLAMDFGKHGYPHRGYINHALELVHIREDYFCLLWVDELIDNCFPDEPNSYYRQLRCTKLQICIDEDSKYLCASLLSTQTYLFEPQVGIMGAIPIFIGRWRVQPKNCKPRHQSQIRRINGEIKCQIILKTELLNTEGHLQIQNDALVELHMSILRSIIRSCGHVNFLRMLIEFR